MIGRLQLWRLLGAMALFAMLSLAPQAANAHVSAHAGHAHAQQPAAAAAQSAPDAAALQKVVVQELTEADPAAPDVDHGCADRGCCSSGPCTGCHGFVVVPVPATVPPTLSSVIRLNDPPPHLGAGSQKLRRPPKSFV